MTGASKTPTVISWRRSSTLLVSVILAVLLYLVWARQGANPLLGPWRVSGRCLRPAYEWLNDNSCLVGLEFGPNPRFLMHFVEKGDDRVMGYAGDYPIPHQPQGVLSVGPANFKSRTWRFRRVGPNLQIRFAPRGPWVTFTPGMPSVVDADFKKRPDHAGVPPPPPPKPKPSRQEGAENLRDAPPKKPGGE